MATQLQPPQPELVEENEERTARPFDDFIENTPASPSVRWESPSSAIARPCSLLR